MSQSSSSKQSVLIGVLSGALVVAIGAAVFLYMNSGVRAVGGAEPAASEASATASETVVAIAPPSVSDSMKELFDLQ